jgi:DNA polymerase (family 10)
MTLTSIDKETAVRILEDIAVMLEISGENPFKSRAYSNAARSLEKVDEDLSILAQDGRIFEIEGVGEAIGKKLIELISTGRLAYYEKLKASIPPGHLEMLKISGLGPKKIHGLYKELGITTIGELEYACHENRLVELKGFGKKTQDNILAGIERLKHYSERRLYDEVSGHAEALLAFLQKKKEVSAISIAGSLRRGNETIKDIDILASSAHPEKLAEAFAGYDEVASVIARGDTKVSISLQSGINADLRIVTHDEFPYALHHFTGSREHNVAMRGRAKDLGLKMNEYGLFQGEKNIICHNEKEIFSVLGLQYIEPELRENMGEIEAAEKGELPRLIEEKDIRGIFHVHTNFSDGADSLEKMATQVKKMGLQYIGVSDHSRSAFYAGGLKVEDIARQQAAIDVLNQKLAPFYIFKGIESDIGPDGSLDYDGEILAGFDFVVAAVHSGFNMSEAEMTGRIKKALANPFTTMLAHPTGRLLLSREPYAVDIQEIMHTAAEYGKALELNANPQRLDLDWHNCIHAVKKGVKIAINPDAHSVSGLEHINLGVKIARKGWLTKDDCLNCLTLKQIKAYLSRKH